MFSFLFLSSSLGRTRPIGRDRILEVESLPLLSYSSRREFSLPWSSLNRDLVTMFIGLESCTKRNIRGKRREAVRFLFRYICHVFKQVERLVGVSSAWIEANSYFHQSLLKCLSSAAPSHFLFLKSLETEERRSLRFIIGCSRVGEHLFPLPSLSYIRSFVFGLPFSFYRFR